MPSSRTQTAFRLSETAIKNLDKWAKNRGHSRTAILETLIREEAKRVARRYSLTKKKEKE